MSWSVYAKGTPSEVKESTEKAFASAKANTGFPPAERKQIEAAEAIVNAAIEHAVENDSAYIAVESYGSGFLKSGTTTVWPGGLSCTVNVVAHPQAPKS